MTAKVILYHQKTLANGEHPLMLRLLDGNQVKYKSLGVSVKPSAFVWETKEVKSGRNAGNRKKVPVRLKSVRDKNSRRYKDYLALVTLIKGIEE